MSLANILANAFTAGHAGPGEAWPLLEPIDPSRPARPAAVLFAITERPAPGLILTRRTEQLRAHAGQIALPGGRIDADDDGPAETALREAQEEIGLDPAQVQLIGISDNFRSGSGFDVTPVIGVIPPDLPLVAQEAEVAEIFEVPLGHLFDPSNWQIGERIVRNRQHRYYEIDWQHYHIWGLTASLITRLARRLAPWPA
jgi:8-oxo-dGTP pyrophosphatase MutT (NUDIX family)